MMGTPLSSYTMAKTSPALCLSENRVYQLIASKILPKALGRGEYDLVASARAYITYLQTERTTTGTAKARERLLLAQAAKAEHELQKDQDGSLPIADMQFFLDDVLVRQRQHLMQLPSVLMRELGDTTQEKVKVKALAEDRVREYLGIVGAGLKGLRHGRIMFIDEDEEEGGPL